MMTITAIGYADSRAICMFPTIRPYTDIKSTLNTYACGAEALESFECLMWVTDCAVNEKVVAENIKFSIQMMSFFRASNYV